MAQPRAKTITAPERRRGGGGLGTTPFKRFRVYWIGTGMPPWERKNPVEFSQHSAMRHIRNELGDAIRRVHSVYLPFREKHYEFLTVSVRIEQRLEDMAIELVGLTEAVYEALDLFNRSEELNKRDSDLLRKAMTDIEKASLYLLRAAGEDPSRLKNIYVGMDAENRARTDWLFDRAKRHIRDKENYKDFVDQHALLFNLQMALGGLRRAWDDLYHIGSTDSQIVTLTAEDSKYWHEHSDEHAEPPGELVSQIQDLADVRGTIDVFDADGEHMGTFVPRQLLGERTIRAKKVRKVARANPSRDVEYDMQLALDIFSMDV